MTRRPKSEKEPPRSATSVPSSEDKDEPEWGDESDSRWLARTSQHLAASLDYENTLSTVAGMALPYLGSWCIVDLVEADGSMRRLDIIHPDPDKEECAHRLKEGWPPRRDDKIGVPG